MQHDRIAAIERCVAIAATEATTNDLVLGRRLHDRHELVETTETQYVVRNTPLDPGGQEFESWTVWIDKTTFVPTTMEYVDDTGEVYRRIEALEVQEIDGIPTVTRMRASDLRSGGNTVSEFSDIEYRLGIPADVFTERTMRNPSRRWFPAR